MEFTIPDWRPASLNTLLRVHWARRAKMVREAKDLIGAYFMASGLPKAVGQRRVTITVVYQRKAGGVSQDGDNACKLILDGLKTCGALVDDSPEWCESVTVKHERGERRAVRVKLEDVA